MAFQKLSKDDLAQLLKKIAKQDNMDDVQATLDEIADEYNIDLMEPEELDEEPSEFDLNDPLLESADDDYDEDEEAWKF